MKELIETNIETTDGTADCRLELLEDGTYDVTILYPNIVNGFSRPQVFNYIMKASAEGDNYEFAYAEDMHPKIQKLESQISDLVTR